jgi:hypothetical protein
MFPSIETIGLGFAITAVLALIDWYVWRTAPTLPYPLPALSTRPADERSLRPYDDRSSRTDAGDDAADFQEVA